MHAVCGYHYSWIEHPDEHPLVPDTFTCPFCAATARQNRVWEEEDRLLEKRIGKPQRDRPYPTDGLTRFLRPATAEEIAKAQARREEVSRGRSLGVREAGTDR